MLIIFCLELYDENPMIVANAIVALVAIYQYRPMLEEKIEDLLKDENYLNVKAAIFVIGEIDMRRKKYYIQCGIMNTGN